APHRETEHPLAIDVERCAVVSRAQPAHLGRADLRKLAPDDLRDTLRRQCDGLTPGGTGHHGWCAARGATVRYAGNDTSPVYITIHCTPNRSVHVPYCSAHAVGCSGISLWPPAESRSNTAAASFALSVSSAM